MAHYVFFEPHPDDATLSMGLAATCFLASGGDVHIVGMSRGAVTPASIKLDGASVCGYDNYTHNPTEEQYVVPTQDQIGAARVLEAESAAGAMSVITPSAGVSAGTMTYHQGGPNGFAIDEFGSSGSTPIPGLTCTQEGVTAATAIIQWYVENYPNTFFFTMSPTDQHPDHAACGQALRNLKNDPVHGPALVNARHFVSRLYWDYSKYPAVAQQPNLTWFDAGVRKADCDAVLRNDVIRCYSAWDPAAGAFAIGYHQVVNQFASNFGPSVTIANLWHA